MAKRPRDDDSDLDDEPPRRKRSRPIDDDDEPRPRSRRRDDEDDAPPPRKKPRPVVDDDDDAPPPRKKRRPVDDDEDDRPLKKKSRLTKKDRARMRREDDDARDAANTTAMMEWGPPIFLAFLGVAMITVAGVIMANRTDGLINPPVLLGVAFVFTLVLIPLIILALMVIGGVMGIEYGTLTNAVRSLAAISILLMGIQFVGHLYLLGWMLSPLIGFIVTFGLFMVFFNLDSQEAMTTLGALNIMMWLADKLFWIVIVVALSRGGNRDRDFDPDAGPRVNQKGDRFNNHPNGFDPDDDPDN